ADPTIYQEGTAFGRGKLQSLERRLRASVGDELVAYDAHMTNGHIANASLDAFASHMEVALKRRVEFALQQVSGESREVRHWSFARDRLSHFTGQDEALARFSDYLRSPAPAPFIVTGESGIGKTTLMLKANEIAQGGASTVTALSYFIGGSTAVATVADL